MQSASWPSGSAPTSTGSATRSSGCCYLWATDPSVTTGDIRDVAGPAAAYDDWAVTRAIERGNAAVALRELGLALEQGAVPYMVLGQLAWVARSRVSAAGDSACGRCGVSGPMWRSSGRRGDPRVLARAARRPAV